MGSGARRSPTPIQFPRMAFGPFSKAVLYRYSKRVLTTIDMYQRPSAQRAGIVRDNFWRHISTRWTTHAILRKSMMGVKFCIEVWVCYTFPTWNGGFCRWEGFGFRVYTQVEAWKFLPQLIGCDLCTNSIRIRPYQPRKDVHESLALTQQIVSHACSVHGCCIVGVPSAWLAQVLS